MSTVPTMLTEVDGLTADTPHRAPRYFLNYRGNVVPDIHRRIRGFDEYDNRYPRTLGVEGGGGEPLFPVTARYDVERDRTRVGLTIVAPAPVDAPARER